MSIPPRICRGYYYDANGDTSASGPSRHLRHPLPVIIRHTRRIIGGYTLGSSAHPLAIRLRPQSYSSVAILSLG